MSEQNGTRQLPEGFKRFGPAKVGGGKLRPQDDNGEELEDFGPEAYNLSQYPDRASIGLPPN